MDCAGSTSTDQCENLPSLETDGDSKCEDAATDGEVISGDQCEDTDVLHGDAGEEKPPTLTKSMLKRLKKKEKWEQEKVEKRKAERERYKARKKAKIERGEERPPSRKQLSKNKMSKSGCKVKVVVDCDFDQYMVDKDIKMLVKQIQYSYSANRRAENPLQFYCCGVTGKTRTRLEDIGDYKGWDINFHSEGYLEMFDKRSVVYLSSESPNVLEKLDDDKVYIIGGLVDHNHHKGLCHQLAVERGVSHAQLAISDYIDMKTRKVLTINHVFEILLNYTETKDWQQSFYKVLPPRKGAVPKNENISNKGDNSCDTSDTVKGDNSCQPAEQCEEKKQSDNEGSENDAESECNSSLVKTESSEVSLTLDSSVAAGEKISDSHEADSKEADGKMAVSKVTDIKVTDCKVTTEGKVEHSVDDKNEGLGEVETTLN